MHKELPLKGDWGYDSLFVLGTLFRLVHKNRGPLVRD